MIKYKLKSGNLLVVSNDSSAESPDVWKNEDVFLVYDHRNFTVKREGFEPKKIFEHLNAKKPLRVKAETFNREDGFDLQDYDLAEAAYNLEYNDYIESINLEYNNYYIFPVDAYIHSGVNLSLANTKNYPDRKWDVSTTGYILVKKDMVKSTENLDANKILDFPNHLETRAKEYAEGLIETWNQYLSGDVYMFKVLKPFKTYTITEKMLKAIKLIEPINNNPRDMISLKEFYIAAKEDIEYEEIDSCGGFYGSDPKTNGMLEYINDEIIE